MIDIRLKVFYQVATHLSFTKASQALFISQPAISKHIQELEKEYNVRLFERLGSHIQLTKAGRLMLDHAHKILKDYQKLSNDMNALLQHPSGELRIGASTTISQYIVPELIAGFHRQFPHIRITMLSGNSRKIEAALAHDKIDMGMVEGSIRQPQFKYTPFMDDELVGIVRHNHPFIQAESITLDALKTTPVVIREFGSGTLDVIQQALKQQGISLSDLNIEMHFGTTEGIKHYVEHSDSLGIVSIRSVNKDIYANIFRLIEIEGIDINRRLMLVEKQGENSEQARQFKQFITSGYKS
ncbi:MAG: LysR family transcriptional regulator [Prevotellaceae bacterium]|nr:LysR family transcriptional regulator [Prevotellaceae bacterium]MDY3364558.1 LysR family transcriptional regulator [Prevotella sp.]